MTSKYIHFDCHKCGKPLVELAVKTGELVMCDWCGEKTEVTKVRKPLERKA